MCLSGAEAGIDHSAPAHAWHRFQAAPHQLLAAGQAFVPNQLVHQERTIADCSTTPLAAAVAAAAAAAGTQIVNIRLSRPTRRRYRTWRRSYESHRPAAESVRPRQPSPLGDPALRPRIPHPHPTFPSTSTHAATMSGEGNPTPRASGAEDSPRPTDAGSVTSAQDNYDPQQIIAMARHPPPGASVYPPTAAPSAAMNPRSCVRGRRRQVGPRVWLLRK
jgi:hypothetical protein